MKYIPLGPNHSARMDGASSMYAHACPTCGAPPYYRCTSLNSTDRFGGYHRAREQKPVNIPLPDMRDKWKEWAQYEGVKPKPRPKDLQV